MHMLGTCEDISGSLLLDMGWTCFCGPLSHLGSPCPCDSDTWWAHARAPLVDSFMHHKINLPLLAIADISGWTSVVDLSR